MILVLLVELEERTYPRDTRLGGGVLMSSFKFEAWEIMIGVFASPRISGVVNLERTAQKESILTTSECTQGVWKVLMHAPT
jgi:hypothetical protein